ncbi:MAG TPA: glycosyltransferase family 2 protein [Terriglobales bacterium]|nr:glycosyltransferase family 2 protein [Terriglobales bacterium]
MQSEANPVVSVIVPARNEEACLARCLESLVTQTGIDFEIVVVDDDSTDRTGEIARSFSSVKVIQAGPLPENWTGKNNAMAAGAKIAKGKWLLFTDADTVHKPGSLARAVAEAEQHGAALLSYSPEQEVRTFWEKAVMPVIFAELAAAYPPEKVSDPSSPIAAANGQYLLISREAYDAVGGHSKIANDLLEDVAMARLVKSSGRKVLFRYGGDAVSTRMYRDWAQMKEGWTKNLTLLFSNSGQLAIMNLVLVALLIGGARASFSQPLSHLLLPPWPTWQEKMLVRELLLALFLLLYFLNRFGFFLLLAYVLVRTRKAHFPWKATVLAPVGLLIFSYLLLRSRYLYAKGRLAWKDRTYVYSTKEIEQLKQGGASGLSEESGAPRETVN